ncbi:MAG: hypothetical protein K9M44_01230 [Candidatus Pacebacteria bacterium]|nr:hypothetical protein [Candidatus Paceibacterota bacterium]
MKKQTKQKPRYFPNNADLIRTSFSDEERIRIVNPDDFPLQEMLSITRLRDYVSMLGITDGQEIKRRTEMFRFLRKHPEIEGFLYSLRGYSLSIPINQQAFLDFFDPKNEHNPYWSILIEFVNFFKKYSDKPRCLAEFISKLEENFSLEELENDFGRKVSAEIQKSSMLTGLAKFRLSLSVENYEPEDLPAEKKKEPKLQVNVETPRRGSALEIEEVKGYQAFSFALSNFQPLKLPAWTGKWWAKLLGLKKIQKSRHERINAQRKQRAYKSMLFETFGDKETSFANELFSFLKSFFNDMVFPDNRENKDNPYAGLEQFLSERSVMVNGKLAFYFSKEGLRLQVVDFQLENYIEGVFPVPYTEVDNIVHDMNDVVRFSGFSKEESDFLVAGASSISKNWKNNLQRSNAAFLLLWLNHVNYDVFKPFTAESEFLKEKYQWVFLENIYNSPIFKDLHSQLTQYREFYVSGSNQLLQYLTINRKVVNFAKQFNCPTTVPEILDDDQHVVGFQNLLPMNMLIKQKQKEILGTKEAALPILINNFPQINGNIVFLTGFHGGGKTTAGQSALLMSYLALSGIPVWASSFKINRKTALGSIVSSEGAESTATVLLEKTNALVRTADELPNNQVLFFIDEIGKGTQEVAGIDLGLDLMETFTEKQISLLVNSQIIQLAELAQKHYGAICLKVNDKHQFVPGIADGGMDKLRKKTGINKYLKKSKVRLQ